MPETVTPNKIQQAVRRGFQRMHKYRQARAMFIKEFVGSYYRNTQGLTGDEPINLIFHTIRTLVPNLVMKNPVNELTTRYTPQKMYGELLGLAIDETEREINLKKTLRAWIVDAIFAFGVTKTGVAASGEMLQFGDQNIDPGQVYTSIVDLDDFVFDPVCTNIDKSSFLGSRIRVPRQMLLDAEGYNKDLVMKLPRARFITHDRIEDLTKQSMGTMEMFTLQDFVDVIELWIPEANALITIPDPEQITFDDYLRLTDYYGPVEGPYTLLSFTPPVPNNPFPVAPVSLWYDIHKMANRLFKKMMDQADRQKDILLYNPAQADEALDIVESKDGDSVASVDPKNIQVVSYGGQNSNNESMLRESQVWYNYISGNPDQMAGNIPQGQRGKETATRSSILQSNANISIEDARDILYDGAAQISRKIGWYLHTDPLIKIPLTKRITGGKQVQLWLTPEQRQGDFLKFVFKIRQRSMSRLDPALRSKRLVEFATNLMPAMMNAAMLAAQMGVEFNIRKAITDLANELGIIEDVQDWFDDPEFEQKMMMVMKAGPQDAGKASQISSDGVMQNNGNPMARNIMTPGQEQNQGAQVIAGDAQSAMLGNMGL